MPRKRKPGRPKGSKNKVKRSSSKSSSQVIRVPGATITIKKH